MNCYYRYVVTRLCRKNNETHIEETDKYSSSSKIHSRISLDNI